MPYNIGIGCMPLLNFIWNLTQPSESIDLITYKFITKHGFIQSILKDKRPRKAPRLAKLLNWYYLNSRPIYKLQSITKTVWYWIKSNRPYEDTYKIPSQNASKHNFIEQNYNLLCQEKV